MRANLEEGKTLSAWTDKTFGVHLGVRQCQRLFRQLSSHSANLVRSWPEQIRHGQEEHKKNRKLMADKTVDLRARDEVHFQQQGSRCRRWIPPETKDPVV
jgi:hypothetical protein